MKTNFKSMTDFKWNLQNFINRIAELNQWKLSTKCSFLQTFLIDKHFNEIENLKLADAASLIKYVEFLQ